MSPRRFCRDVPTKVWFPGYGALKLSGYGGLESIPEVLKAHRLLYHSTLVLRVIKKKKSPKGLPRSAGVPHPWTG